MSGWTEEGRVRRITNRDWDTSDLVGMVFGRLKVDKSDGKMCICSCQCGSSSVAVNRYKLLSGNNKSCGCLGREKTIARNFRHGMTYTGEYQCWSGAKSRCLNPRATKYQQYGGRGIRICDRWKDSFENFIADMGSRPPGTTLERVNVNGDYEPGNCTWATSHQQANNKRYHNKITYNGETLNLCEWARRTGMDQSKIAYRLRRGYPIEEVMNTTIDLRRVKHVE